MAFSIFRLRLATCCEHGDAGERNYHGGSYCSKARTPQPLLPQKQQFQAQFQQRNSAFNPQSSPFVTIQNRGTRTIQNINRADPENRSAFGSEYNSSRKKKAVHLPPLVREKGKVVHLADQVVQTIRLQVGNPKEYNDRMKRMRLCPNSTTQD